MSVRFLWVVALVLGTASGAARAGVVADSIADFAGVQGEHSWYYGYFSGSFTPAAFAQFPTFSSQSHSWIESSATSSYWTSLWSTGGHPNGATTSSGRTPVEQWAVRRWVSPFSGAFQIDGMLAKLAPGGLGGNGVAGHIFVDGVEIMSQAIGGTDTAGFAYHLPVSLHVGSIVDFALDPRNSNDLYDSSRFSAVVSSAVGEPSSYSLALAGLLVVAGSCGFGRRRGKSSMEDRSE